MTTLSTLPWNLVTKNLHGPERLRKKLHQKIAKLERHLVHFPSDAVHLQIVLERHPKKLLHTATLTLRVPSNILHSEKSAPDIISAFDNAVKALLREPQSLKADLRRERFWKRKVLLPHPFRAPPPKTCSEAGESGRSLARRPQGSAR